MKTAVIYTSVSGFTKKYAKWIAESLKGDLFTLKESRWKDLDFYDTIIYGGSLHAVGINGLKRFQKRLSERSNKKIIIFAVGASSYKEGLLEEIAAHNLSKELQEKAKLFYLRGGFDKEKLNLANRIIMAFFVRMLKKKKDKSPDDNGMIAAYEHPVNFTKKENIKELIAYAKK